MAITIDRSVFPYVINVPKADMLLLQSSPSEIRQLDLNAFRLELKGIDAATPGMPFTRSTWHNDGVTVGGAVLAKVIVITDDYVVEFEDDQYRVLCVGANSNIGERTVVNQVSVSTSNSAGLQDLNSLQAASFDGAVAVDVNSAFSGTVFPVGTRGFPVNNLTDALTICEGRGIRTVLVMASMTLDSGTDYSAGYTFTSDNPEVVTVTLDPNINVTNASFMNLTITGTLDGNNIFRDCVMLDCSYINGVLWDCALSGVLTLGGGGQADLINCHSGFAGGGAGQYAEVDMGGSGNSLIARDYSGGLDISNYTGGGDISLDFDSGRLIVDSTVTAGDIYVRGICNVTDGSTGTTVIYDQTVSHDVETSRKLLSNRQELVDVAGVTHWISYDDDDSVLVDNIVTDSGGDPVDLPDGAVIKRSHPQ